MIKNTKEKVFGDKDCGSDSKLYWSVNTAIKGEALRAFKTAYWKAKKTKGAKRPCLDYKSERDPLVRCGSFSLGKAYCKWLEPSPCAKRACLSFMSDTLAGSRSRRGKNSKIPRNRYLKCKSSASLVPPIEHSVRLVKYRNGKYQIHIPCDASYMRSNKQNKQDENAICAIDPGVRTMYTVVDVTRGEVTEYGLSSDMQKLMKPLQDKADLLRCEIHCREKKSGFIDHDVRAGMCKVNYKIRKLIDSLHQQTIGSLVKNFRAIILGGINPSKCIAKKKNKKNKSLSEQMLVSSVKCCHDEEGNLYKELECNGSGVSGDKKKLNKKTTRNMLTWS